MGNDLLFPVIGATWLLLLVVWAVGTGVAAAWARWQRFKRRWDERRKDAAVHRAIAKRTAEKARGGGR